MATRKLTAEDLRGVREFAKQWGKIISRRAYCDQGPGPDVDLAQMEQVAHAAAQGLTAGVLEETTSRQAELLGAHPSCPECGRCCSELYAKPNCAATSSGARPSTKTARSASY